MRSKIGLPDARNSASERVRRFSARFQRVRSENIGKSSARNYRRSVGRVHSDGAFFESGTGLRHCIFSNLSLSAVLSTSYNARLFSPGGVSYGVGSFPRQRHQNNFAGRLFGALGCRIWVPSRKQGQDYAIPKIFCVAGGVASYFGRKREGAGLWRRLLR